MCLARACRFGSKTGEEGSPCYKCPAGSYSPGNSYAPCRACPDGYTSAAGSTHAKHCVPLFKECGIGGYLPEASLAHEGCHAYPGYGLQRGGWALLMTTPDVLRAVCCYVLLFLLGV